MPLLEIIHVGSLTATAAHDGNSGSTTSTDELPLPAGYFWYPVTKTNAFGYTGSLVISSRENIWANVYWSLTLVPVNTVRLTVTASPWGDSGHNAVAEITATAQVYGYKIDNTKYWGMQSLLFMRRGVNPLE